MVLPKAVKGNRLIRPRSHRSMPYVGKIRRGRPKTSTRPLSASSYGDGGQSRAQSVIALANAAGSSRSSTGERLRRLSETGAVEKDTTGRWHWPV